MERTATSAAPAPDQVSTPEPGSSAPKLGSFQDFMAGMAHVEERAPAPAEVPRVKSEAALYLDLPSVPMDAHVLEWWALNEMKFPALIVMARQTRRAWHGPRWLQRPQPCISKYASINSLVRLPGSVDDETSRL